MTGVRVERDLIYSSPVGYRPLTLDLYLPDRPATLTCLYLHGGGWRAGSRRVGPGPSASWSPSFFEVAAGFGIVVASVDYRLSGEARFPAQLDDVCAAADFLIEQRELYGLPQELAVWGGSAGGHLAALYALQPAAVAQPVRGAVCWYSPTDLDALSVDTGEIGREPDRTADSREGRLVGGALDDCRDLVVAASPVNHVRASPPPFLFLHGTADVAVPPRQSERLATVLRAAGGSATVDLIFGGTHMFARLDDTAMLAAIQRSVRFLLEPSRG